MSIPVIDGGEPVARPLRQALMARRPAARRAALARLVLVALLGATVVACSSAGAPSPPATTPAGASPSLGAGTDPNQPGSTDLPPASFDPGRPDPGGAQLVVPKPGQLDVHPRPAEWFTTTVDGHHLVVTIGWTSGVEPCTVLDSIVVERSPGTFTLTLREGRGPGDVVCIEIAQAKRAVVDLGDVASGTYRIVDGLGGAPTVEVTIG